MIPAWIKRGQKWVPGVLVEAVQGSGSQWLLVSYDDDPAPRWGYPPGSMVLDTKQKEDVRLRRSVIPLLPDEAGK